MSYPVRFIFLVIKIGVVAIIIPACSKPARVETGNDASTPPMTAQQERDIPAPASSAASMPEDLQPSPATALPSEGAPKSAAASLERRYLATTDPEVREDIVEQLGDLDNAEAVQVFRRLFQGTTDQEAKIYLLSMLEQMDTNVGQLPILAAAVSPDQPPEVRTAAIDALAAIDEPAALHLLEGLTNDSDPQISEAAKVALQRTVEAIQNTSR